MTSLEEAQELENRIRDAIGSMKRLDNFGMRVKECEVKFRYEAVVGILIMAVNDVSQMVKEWTPLDVSAPRRGR